MRRVLPFIALVLMAATALLARLGMTGHMAAHMIAVALAAPVLAVSVRGTAFESARWSPLFGNALAMSVLELFTVWCWHLPRIRTAVAHGAALFALELACFLVVGTLLWSAVLATRPEARAVGGGALLLTSMHMTLLGALIGLAPRALYPAMAHGAPAGLTPLQDQQLSGVIMLLVGGVSYLVGGLAVMNRMLRDEVGPA